MDTVAYRPRPRPFANHPAERIARELGLEPRRAERVRLAALLCDIGAARIPTGVLDKRGPLTADEWEAVRRHPEDSAAMLGGPGYDDLRPWIVAHHERPDGRGYPFGLPAREIPIEAAIVSVATAWEAMTDERPHRPALTEVHTLRELMLGSGTQFDPDAVAAALSALAPAVVDQAA